MDKVSNARPSCSAKSSMPGPLHPFSERMLCVSRSSLGSYANGSNLPSLSSLCSLSSRVLAKMYSRSLPPLSWHVHSQSQDPKRICIISSRRNLSHVCAQQGPPNSQDLARAHDARKYSRLTVLLTLLKF